MAMPESLPQPEAGLPSNFGVLGKSDLGDSIPRHTEGPMEGNPPRSSNI